MLVVRDAPESEASYFCVMTMLLPSFGRIDEALWDRQERSAVTVCAIGMQTQVFTGEAAQSQRARPLSCDMRLCRAGCNCKEKLHIGDQIWPPKLPELLVTCDNGEYESKPAQLRRRI